MKRILALFLALLMLVSVVSCSAVTDLFASGKSKTKKAVEEYVSEVADLKWEILTTAATAEHLASMIKQVWNNTIHKKSSDKTDEYTKLKSGDFYSDFNYALDAYMSSEEYLNGVAKIEGAQSELLLTVRRMRDHPEECDHLYEALKEYHAVCDELMEMALSPSGSLNSFSSQYNQVEERFAIKSRDLEAEIKLLQDD